MKDIKSLNFIDRKLVGVYESLSDAVVSEDSEVGQFYIDTFGDSWTTEDKTELMAEVITSLNEWFENDNVIDTIKEGETLEDVGDYLPLFLGLPNDTTVLAVGNGAVAAPSTTTAYLHTSYDDFSVLAIYDYEDEENAERMRTDLEELFPSVLINDYVVTLGTKSGFGSQTPYKIVIRAENEAEAITKAMKELNDSSDIPMNDFVDIKVQTKAEARAEREAEENAKIYTCDVCDSIYTGGGIWCTVYQLSGSDSDIYYAIDNTFDEFDGMAQYSHKKDRLCGSDDEYGFMETTRNITVSEMTEDEKIIWLKLKLKEAETLRNEY